MKIHLFHILVRVLAGNNKLGDYNKGIWAECRKMSTYTYYLMLNKLPGAVT